MVSPLYPGLLGAVFSLSGIFTVQSAAIILFFNCVVSGLTCVPLMYAARRLYGPAVALACGVAWAASPYAVWHAAYAVQDASLTAFVFTAVLWAVLRLPSEQKIWPWAALGALLGVVTRGTSLAIGVGILYALVIEGLLSAFADSISALEPLTEVFLRANGYSLAASLGASAESIGSSGPGSFSGPFVSSGQALAVLVVLGALFTGIAAMLLRRRDVT
jgi:hypothetical protein